MSNHLPPELTPLVAAERNAPSASSDEREQIRARVCATLGLAGPGSGGGAGDGGTAPGADGSAGAGRSAASAQPAATGSTSAVALKSFAVVAIVAGAVGAGLYFGRDRGSREPLARDTAAPVVPSGSPATQPAAPAHEAAAPASDPPTAPEPTPPGPAVNELVPTPAARSGAESNAPDTASVEAAPSGTESSQPAPTPVEPEAEPADPPQSPREGALLAAAYHAVEGNQPERALAALAEHEAKFPNGVLAEERDALRVRALLEAGDRQAATARAAAFRREYPRSIHLAAIDRAFAAQAEPPEALVSTPGGGAR